MGKFSHLSKGLSIDPSKSQPYTFTDLITQPTLYFRPGTEDNKDYAAALLKIATVRGRRRNKKSEPVKALQAQRKVDITLIVKFCLTGWKGVKDEKGNDVPFTIEDGFEMLSNLEHWIQDKVRNWVQDPSNFTTAASEEEDDEFGLDDLAGFGLDNLDDLIENADTKSEPLGKSSGK